MLNYDLYLSKFCSLSYGLQPKGKLIFKLATKFIIMKFKVLIFISCLLSASMLWGQSNEAFFNKADAFFKKHVDGGVDYTTISSSRSALDELLDLMKWAEVETFSKEETIAFWVNSYNLIVIDGVIDLYPISSVNAVSDFFTKKNHVVAREKLSLEQIEKQKLLKDHFDARYHFVLVCGAEGCPPLVDFAYMPDQLENQLEAQTRLALTQKHILDYDAGSNTLRLSQIFNWYKPDFTKGGQSLVGYVNSYIDEAIPSDARIKFMEYDWSLNQVGVAAKPLPKDGPSNIQKFTPSVLLGQKQFQIKWFNNLYTQNGFFDQKLKRQLDASRSNFLSSIFQFEIGALPRLNIGFDLYLRSVAYRTNPSSPLEVLKFQNDPQSRVALTSFGPKFKYAPFKLKGLSTQSTLLFPMAKNLQGFTDTENPSNSRPFIDHDGYQFFQQFFYDKVLNAQLSVFAEAGLWVKIDRRFKKDNTGVVSPLKGFLSYFPHRKITVYGMTEFAPDWGGAFYLQSGLGTKFQLTPQLEMELLYTNFWLGLNSGAGQTFNVGFRFLN